MKKISAAMLIVTVAVMATFAVGCGAMEKVGVAYGLVHNYYVGQAKITVNGDKITALTIEETEGPASWAKKTNIKDEAAEGVDFTEGGFARRISVGSVTFTATDDAATKTPNYRRSNDDVTFEEWVKTEENAKFYVEHMASGDYKILKADGSAAMTDFSVEKNNLKKGERWLKSKNGYWQGSEQQLGWKGNIDRITDFVKRKGISGYTGEEVKGENGWVVDGVNTGATLVDFHDYMKLVKSAYDTAM